jgi:hypothetical protein
VTAPPQELEADHIRIAVFLVCIVAAAVGGYILARLGGAGPALAKRVMSAAIIGCDAPIAWLAIWFLNIDPAVWKVPVAGAIVAVAATLVGLAVARRARLPLRDQAVFGLQSGMGNVGYTLGGAICFALWNMDGLSLEQFFCVMWPFYAFGLCFPIARHYGEQAAIREGAAAPVHAGASAGRYAARLVWKSLTDLRSLPLYMATLGLALNLGGAAPPQQVRQWHLIDALMVGGILLQFGGVGMTVEVRRLWGFWKEALGTAGIKMLLSPALMLGVGLALGMTGVPLYVCLLLAAMPTALYSVLMANLFNLNRDLANATFILTHVACLVIVVPLVVLWPG